MVERQAFGQRRLAWAVIRWGLLFLLVTIGAASLGFASLGDGFSQKKLDINAVLDIVKVALTVAGGLGAVIALTVAYRKQSLTEQEHILSLARREEEILSDFRIRFEKSAEMLGSSSLAVRLAGVRSLGTLGNEWPRGNQTCVDLLCAYFRASQHAVARRMSEALPRRSTCPR